MSQSILTYNGGAVLAMTGKNCVAIATDTRYGIRAQTVAMDFPKVFKLTDQCFIGLPGLATDTQTVLERLRFRTKLYKLREERDMKPSVLSKMVSALLYEKRCVGETVLVARRRAAHTSVRQVRSVLCRARHCRPRERQALHLRYGSHRRAHVRI